MKRFIYISCILFFLISRNRPANACTIFSGIDKKGQVWAGNNEDNVFNFNTYFHTIASTDSTLGFIYFTNSSKSTEYFQGGVNEAGLFYDANAVPSSPYKDYDKKKDFPGGANALIQHILKKFKTVTEVMDLLKVYRLEGLQSGQLHFADKYGNLGIVVADSMWITESNYQVSTNYNLCHSNKDGESCWRFPIAQRILQSKEPGFDSFREICDLTHQKNIASTVYSNIHNLKTGDMWLFYGGDFNKPYITNISDLLKKGTSAFPLYELFTGSPLVMAYKAYQSNGIDACIQELNSSDLTPDKRTEMGRLLYYDLVVCNHDINSYPVLAGVIEPMRRSDELMQFIDAIPLFCTGKKKEALNLLNNYLKEQPKGRFAVLVTLLSNEMQGIYAKDANVTFELTGFENAKCVSVEGIDFPNVRYFLYRKNGKWFGKFKIDPDEYSYYFMVDGKRVLDSKNPDTIKLDGLEYNKLVVKKNS